MKYENNLRIDKWLWAVRIFKTRSQAAQACKKGRIIIDNVQVKPSRTVKVGEVVFVKRPPVTYQYKILGLLSNRKSAKIAADYVEDITPEEEKVKLEMKNYTGFEIRQKGYGRPTKRERRLIDKLKKKY
ncbi:MAG TPA: S4 domain-containing protein [Bacteroidales bacterium]|nr:S4 domain-containing protein [Bacteroidales bacterium]